MLDSGAWASDFRPGTRRFRSPVLPGRRAPIRLPGAWAGRMVLVPRPPSVCKPCVGPSRLPHRAMRRADTHLSACVTRTRTVGTVGRVRYVGEKLGIYAASRNASDYTPTYTDFDYMLICTACAGLAIGNSICLAWPWEMSSRRDITFLRPSIYPESEKAPPRTCASTCAKSMILSCTAWGASRASPVPL